MSRVTFVTALLLVLCALPAWAQDRFFEANGVRIHYVDEGTGEPIVLIHGYTNYVERNWIETGVLSSLAKGHRVIALDLRGHGQSSKPHTPEAYGTQMSLDIVRLLDHLQIARAHIVGYSLGGIVMAKLLTTHARFASATFVAASGRRSWSPEAARNAEATARELESGLPYRSLILATAPSDQPPPTEEAIRQTSQEFLRHNDPLAHAALNRAGGELAVTDSDLAATGVPSLAIVGTADAAAAGVKALQARWPALEVVLIEGATHWGERGVLLRPEFAATVTRFIASHSGAAKK